MLGGASLGGFALAAALFVTGMWRLRRTTGLLRASTQAGLPRDGRPLHSRLLTAAIVLGAATFALSSGNRFTVFSVSTWVASVVCGMAALWEGEWRPAAWWERVRQIDRNGVRILLSWHALALAGVLLIGAFLLFYRIHDIPREMTSDHAEKLYDVRDVLDGQYRIFFPRNTGREAFQFYLIAAMTPLSGVSYLTMKLGTALLAFGTLPFTYLLARTLFGARVALLATAILASTRWLWQVGRVGLRFPFPPLFGAAIFAFLLRAIRDRRRNDFLLCGLALGAAQHTYTALRLAPLAVLGCVAIAAADDYLRLKSLERVRRLAIDTALLVFVSLLVFMPLARYATEEPQMFVFRGLTRIASDSPSAPPPNVVGTFLDNVKNALLMFNWRGDTVWVNTIPNAPFLDPVSGALFVLGCTYALYRLGRYRELPFLHLLVLLFVGLLPSILTLAYPHENPSTVRTGMAIPITALLIAAPLALIARRLRAWVGDPVGKYVSATAIALTLAAILAINFHQYFHVYSAQHASASQHTTYVASAIRGFIQLGGRKEDAYVLPGTHWIDWRLVAIEVGDERWAPIVNDVEDARRHDGAGRQRLYVVHPSDQRSLDTFSRWYPSAIQTVHRVEDAGGNPWFVTVFVPAGARVQADS